MGTGGVIVADLSISEAGEGERWAEAVLSDDSHTGEAGLWAPGPELMIVDVPDDGSPGFNKTRLAGAQAGQPVVTSGQPPSLTWHPHGL